MTTANVIRFMVRLLEVVEKWMTGQNQIDNERKGGQKEPSAGATAAVINQNGWRCGIESLEWCSDWHHETAANKPFQFEKCAGVKSTFLGTASRFVSGLSTVREQRETKRYARQNEAARAADATRAGESARLHEPRIHASERESEVVNDAAPLDFRTSEVNQ
jgi:hypothetical protein